MSIHFDDVSTGSDLQLPRYGTLTRVVDSGVGVLFRTRALSRGQDIDLRVGVGDDARAIDQAFDIWKRCRESDNVRTVYNIARSPELDLVALEMDRYVQTLAEYVAIAPLSLAKTVQLGLALSDALRAMHRRRIAHRHIDATKVVISGGEQIQISDLGFGAAAPATADDLRIDVMAVGALMIDAAGAELVITADPDGSRRAEIAYAGNADRLPDEVRTVLLNAATGAIPTGAELWAEMVDLYTTFMGPSDWSPGFGVPPKVEDVGPNRYGTARSATGDATLSDTSRRRATPPNEPSPAPVVAIPQYIKDDKSAHQPFIDQHRGSNISVPTDPPDVVPGPVAVESTEPPPRRWWPAILALLVILAAAAFTVIRLAWPDSPAKATKIDVPDIVIEPPAISAGTTGGTTVAAAPEAPSGVAAKFTAQNEIELSWLDNSEVEEGYLVEVAVFDVDDNLHQASATPSSTGWIDRDGLKEDERKLVPMPPDTTSRPIVIDPTKIICFRPVAVAIARSVTSAEQQCVPSAGPQEPTVAYAPTNEVPSGAFDVQWTDESFDESHFTVLIVDEKTMLVTDVEQAPANPETGAPVALPPPPLDLAPDSITCFVVRAENAMNRSWQPVGVAAPDDASTTRPVCVHAAPDPTAGD